MLPSGPIGLFNRSTLLSTQYVCFDIDLLQNAPTCCLPGWSQCDARRSLTETKEQFPGVDFSLIQSEDDTMWPEYNGDVKFDILGRRINSGEPESDVTERGIKFLHWLMDR